MWKVKIIRISDDCPYFNENESEINQCSHEDNPTYWRGLTGICDEEFCPIKVLERDNYTCVYCGDKEGPFEVDHVMPKSRGGLDKLSNLVCACRSCNRSKKDKTPEEWLPWR